MGEPVGVMGSAVKSSPAAQDSGPVLTSSSAKTTAHRSRPVVVGRLSKGARMTRKSDLAFWMFMILAGLAGATTVFNVTRTYSATSGNSEIYKQLDLFGDVLERVRSDYVEKPDDSMLIDSAINGMLSALDPHSAYLNPKKLPGHAGTDQGRVRRARHRGHHGAGFGRG